MKILKQGNQKKKTFRGICMKCSCEIEVEEGEKEICEEYDQMEQNMYRYVICPNQICKNRIYI